MFSFLLEGNETFGIRKFAVTGERSRTAKVTLLTIAGTSMDPSKEHYSGSQNRCRRYSVWITSGGNLLLYREDMSRVSGERNIDYCYIFKNKDDLKKYFDRGNGRAEDILLREFDNIGLDLSEFID